MIKYIYINKNGETCDKQDNNYSYFKIEQSLLSEMFKEINDSQFSPLLKKLSFKEDGSPFVEAVSANLPYLRTRRENECFSIINRGQLWYNNLTSSQKNELSLWYENWLNVTETLEIPHKPEWLDRLEK